MAYYQRLKHREENCIIAGINASDPKMVRMWQGNALILDEKRRVIEKTDSADVTELYSGLMELFERPLSSFDKYKIKYDISKTFIKLFPKSGKIIADILNNN